MIPFHLLLPELAQKEVRCVHTGPPRPDPSSSALPADEYIYLEYYCEELDCDCRRVYLEVDLFQRFVLDVPYSLRLRRHYRLFKEELGRRGGWVEIPKKKGDDRANPEA